MNFMDMSATVLSELIRKKKIKISEVLSACFDRIRAYNDVFNVYVTIDEDRAYSRADALQKELYSGGHISPLFGVPVAIKDNICTKDIRTTCCSDMLRNFIPCYSATVVNALENAGMIVVGKTNMDEFAMGNSTETSIFGVTKNPWNRKKVAGGSSGGSAAAVALGMCSVALGSDTGGSVRQPSALCGVTGIKPTYGRVSRNGLIAYASSMDTVGTMGKNICDAATLLECISGYDSGDSTSIMGKNIETDKIPVSLKNNPRIAIPMNMIAHNSSEEMIRLVETAADILGAHGALIEYIDMELEKYVLPVYYTLACSEASSNLQRYDGVRYGYRSENYNNLNEMYKNTRTAAFGSEVKRRIMLGTFALSAGYYDEYYLRALRGRKLISQKIGELFTEYDCILTPVTPGGAYNIGNYRENFLEKYNEDIFTVWANLAGIPAISIPGGLDRNNMPLGIQLMVRHFAEEDMLSLGYIIERNLGIQEGKYDL